MDKLKWYTRQADKQVAHVPMMAVTFVVQTYKSGGIRSEVFIGSWQPGENLPPAGDQILVSAIHTRGDMEDAKDNCLRAFESWAFDVGRIHRRRSRRLPRPPRPPRAP